MEFRDEAHLQSEVVIWFSDKYPQLYGSLFEVNNNPNGIKDAMRRRALGMVAGVSDLILVACNTFAGIELKHTKTKHKKDHISKQLRWGEHVISQGGKYIMSNDIEEIKEFISFL